MTRECGPSHEVVPTGDWGTETLPATFTSETFPSANFYPAQGSFAGSVWTEPWWNTSFPGEDDPVQYSMLTLQIPDVDIAAGTRVWMAGSITCSAAAPGTVIGDDPYPFTAVGLLFFNGDAYESVNLLDASDFSGTNFYGFTSADGSETWDFAVYWEAPARVRRDLMMVNIQLVTGGPGFVEEFGYEFEVSNLDVYTCGAAITTAADTTRDCDPSYEWPGPALSSQAIDLTPQALTAGTPALGDPSANPWVEPANGGYTMTAASILGPLVVASDTVVRAYFRATFALVDSPSIGSSDGVFLFTRDTGDDTAGYVFGSMYFAYSGTPDEFTTKDVYVVGVLPAGTYDEVGIVIGLGTEADGGGFEVTVEDFDIYTCALLSGDAPPTVTIDADETTVRVDQTVHFTAEITGEIDGTYVWDFGDGGGLSDPSDAIPHSYSEVGVYEASVTVEGPGGSDSDSITITVLENVPPTARITKSSTGGTAPKTINFSGLTSSDDSIITLYEWDFDDGDTDTGSTTSHTYTTPGIYHPTLTVTDDDGATHTTSTTITVTTVAGGGGESMACAFALVPDYTMGNLEVTVPEVGVFEFITYAWQPSEEGLIPLWARNSKRGTDVTVPGEPGTLATARRLDAVKYTIKMVLIGDCDKDGVQTPDAGSPEATVMVGYQTNFDYIHDLLNVPPDPADAPLYSATLTKPNGDELNADIRILSVDIGTTGSQGWNMTIDIEVPAGGFV